MVKIQNASMKEVNGWLASLPYIKATKAVNDNSIDQIDIKVVFGSESVKRTITDKLK